MRTDIETTPTELPGVTVGTRYFFQNQSGRTIYVETASSEPTTHSNAIKCPPTGPLSVGFFSTQSGESVYVWGVEATGAVVYTEAP